MNGKIYSIRNNVNDKIYIGQTTLTLKQRFQRHTANNSSNKNTAISKAIKSIGKENFEIFLIKDGYNTIEELNEAEIKYIKKFNSLSPNGYNLCLGGQKWRRKPNISEKDLLVAMDKYKNGHSLRTLASEYETSREYLVKRFKEFGVVIRNKSENLPDRTSILTKEVMTHLYIEENMLVKDIAKLMNVDVRTVNRAKNRFDLKRI